MDRPRSLAALEREAERILSLVEDAGVDGIRPVPTCPDWTLEQIPSHLGRVYAMVSTVLQGEPERPPDREKIPRRPEGQSPTEWMRARFEILVSLLRDASEDCRRWNFVTGPSSPVAFWWRRQLHETLIHRVDAELAAGQPVTPVDPEIAVDGIGDFFVMTRLRRVEGDEIASGEGMSIHLHPTDAGSDAEWTIDGASGAYAQAHLKADVALQGPAWALDRWCWRRFPLDPQAAEREGGLVLFGDRQAAEEWRPTL
jgi:uncharacterized protein (TIGR03083 family)